MGLFDSVLKAVPLLGAAGEFVEKQKLKNKLYKKLNEKPQDLAIPDAYKQLMDNLNSQYGQLGAAKHVEIANNFHNSLTQALAQLQQRGLASSNLTANLTAGSQKKQTEATNQLDEDLLGSQLGMQQQLSLAGLNQSAAERGQLTGIQGSIYGQVAAPTLAGQPFTDMLKNLASFKPSPTTPAAAAAV